MGYPLAESGVPFVHFVAYCEFRLYQDRPVYIRIPIIYRPTYQVLTVSGIV